MAAPATVPYLTGCAIAFVVTLPVNRWMIGRGHAVVHGLHQGRTAGDPGLRTEGRGRG